MFEMFYSFKRTISHTAVKNERVKKAAAAALPARRRKGRGVERRKYKTNLKAKPRLIYLQGRPTDTRGAQLNILHVTGTEINIHILGAPGL